MKRTPGYSSVIPTENKPMFLQQAETVGASARSSRQLAAPHFAYRRVLRNHNRLRPADLLMLQRAVGNHQVQQMVMFSAPSVVQRQANSFESVGYGIKSTSEQTKTITRSEQVLEVYGMTCYGTSVMYMIQSYGLVPPNMSREEFEYAFTPLNPGNNHAAPKRDVIKVGGIEQPGAIPVDLITAALQGTANPTKHDTSLGRATKTEATLRGATSGGLGVADIMKQMPKLLAAFKAQSEKKGYEFMKAYVPKLGKVYTPDETEEKWEDGSTQLDAGTINANYFKAGNTILVGVNYHYPPNESVGHWCVIVREKKETKTIGGQSYHLYPADDPLWGQVYIMAPLLKNATRTELTVAGLRMGDGLTYHGHRIHMLVKGNAYRRKGDS